MSQTSFKYTDIDYQVFSDAATKIYEGKSPYEAHTYRYTPLVAYICLLNNIIHPLAAKLIFCICDIIMGYILWVIINSQIKQKQYTIYYVSIWMLSPLTVNLSTRGSNDNMVSLILFISIYCLLQKRYTSAGIFFGLSVHFKIYPIIYSIIFYFYIDLKKDFLSQNRKFMAIFVNLITKNRLTFTISSVLTFLFLLIFFYLIYGYDFLYQTYLYHLVRKDNRHNFSVYFYLIYQIYEQKQGAIFALMTFFPQWGLVILAGCFLYYDLFFAMFIQTWSFVIFNKVQTAQYLLWYFTLIPLVLINNNLQNNRFQGLLMVVIYFIIEIYWSVWSYKLEVLGINVFNQIQFVNYVWFIINIFILFLFIINQRVTLTKEITMSRVSTKINLNKL